MARFSFKPDASFYRKIAIGAIGVRAVQADLEPHGHELVELERGAAGTRIWKEVKRKRVRIPDLVCKRCGLRIECRAKTNTELSMSHSPTDAERAWDYGMVDSDWIAFPICRAKDEDWRRGVLHGSGSYWHERNWVDWEVDGKINYLTVEAFRSAPSDQTRTKGVTEGSETTISWDASFSTRYGLVERVNRRGITIRRECDGHAYTWRIRPGCTALVCEGQYVGKNEAIAAPVVPVASHELACQSLLSQGDIEQLLTSRERTLRYTGVKLARLRGELEHAELIDQLAYDTEEDIYVRLEAISYLSSIAGGSAQVHFQPYLAGADPQIQLEAVIALGEAGTLEAVKILASVIEAGDQPSFLTSAAAWALGQIGTEDAQQSLVRAFSNVSIDVREEALGGLVELGSAAIQVLMQGLQAGEEDIEAGCAEALRQYQALPQEAVERIARHLGESALDDTTSRWMLWLLGHLPPEVVTPVIASLEDQKPELHFALSVLWSFVNSWISPHWELWPLPRASLED